MTRIYNSSDFNTGSYPKYLNIRLEQTVDPDQTLQNVGYDKGVHCKCIFKKYNGFVQAVKWTCSNFRRRMVKIYPYHAE